MSLEQSAIQLKRLGENMIIEAENGNWQRVSKLHQILHNKLLHLFQDGSAVDDHAGDDQLTYELLTDLQRINERVADAASRERRDCFETLSRTRQSMAAQQSYSAI